MADRGRAAGSFPVGSKRCAQKVWQKNHETHCARVVGMRPAIDVSAPSAHNFEHMRSNLKKERLLEERYVEIDRENKNLLNKMSELMRKQSIFSAAPKEEKKVTHRPDSLNRAGRKNELHRISLENARLLKAIQTTPPVYSTKQWEASYKKSGALLKNCSAYPVVTRLPRVRSEPSILRQIAPEASAEDSALAGASGGDSQDAKFVLKEGKTIGQAYYLIEMATDGRVLNISAYNGETQTSLELVVNEKKHRRIYRECDGDYSKVAERLRVEGTRLILDSPGAD